MDQLPGCANQFRRGGIQCWGIAGAWTGAVGVLWPLVLMVWNFIWNAVALSCCGFCCCGGIAVGTFESCLFPVWCCAKTCACGSCAVLGTTWVNVLTFAGFTGAAWYIVFGNLFIVLGLVCFLVALIFWANSCRIEGTPEPAEKVPEDERSLMQVVDLEANTGELKF